MQIGVIFTRLADIEIYNHHLYMLFFSLSPSSIFLLSFLPYSSFSPYFLPTSPILSFPLLSPPPFFSPFILGFVPFSLPSTPYFKYKSSHFFPPFSIRKKYLPLPFNLSPPSSMFFSFFLLCHLCSFPSLLLFRCRHLIFVPRCRQSFRIMVEKHYFSHMPLGLMEIYRCVAYPWISITWSQLS